MKRMIVVAALMLVAGAAYAQDAETQSSFNVGVSGVFSDYKGDASLPIEDSSLGMAFHAQAKANKWFGAEIGYYNSGTFSSNIDPNSNRETDITLSGFNVSVLGFFPIFSESEFDFEIFGRVGLYDYDIKLTQQQGSSNVPSSLGQSVGAFLGAGFVMNLSETVGLRTEIQGYDIDNADLYSLNLGIQVGF